MIFTYSLISDFSEILFRILLSLPATVCKLFLIEAAQPAEMHSIPIIVEEAIPKRHTMAISAQSEEIPAPKDGAQTTAARTSYDDVLYESHSYPATQPPHLFTVGTLFGLTPPPLETARVLELGSALGGNLLPLALDYPRATFVGVDLSREQTEAASRTREDLGLTNVTFLQRDILDITEELGTFDYIICHGILSWVPENVRGKVLDICRDHLTPSGLAVVSYNALPGWHFIGGLRDMMRYHCRNFTTPQEQISQAVGLLDFLSENAPPGQQAYKTIIDNERRILTSTNPSYIFHDHLENTNTPFYLHDFVDRIKERGLHYVGDSSLPSMHVGSLPVAAREKIRQISDPVRREQYMDFLHNRRFKFSIISRQSPGAGREIDPDSIFRFYVEVNMKARDETPDTEQPVTFVHSGGSGASFTTQKRAVSEFYLELTRQAPRRVLLKDVILTTQKKLGLKTPQPLERAARNFALPLVMSGFLSLTPDRDRSVTGVSEKPCAAPLARIQARDPQCRMVINAHRTMTRIDLFTQQLLRHLDGSKNRKDLEKIMTDLAMHGELPISESGEPVKETAILERILPPLIEQALQKMAAGYLLIA